MKGAKEIELLHNDQLVWNGILRRGCGNEYEDYVTYITLSKEGT